MDFRKILELAKQKKGVAGLNVYMSLIAMIFMIGIIVMVFAIAGGKLGEAAPDALSSGIINNTTASISSATSFFSTFIVLGAMVVLILLVVIIINSIRASGIASGGA